MLFLVKHDELICAAMSIMKLVFTTFSLYY